MNFSKKMIHEDATIKECTFSRVKDLISKLSEFPPNSRVELAKVHGYYDDIDLYLDISWEREETDEEYEKRIESEQKARIKAAKDAEAKKAQKEVEDYRKYLELKKKYANAPD